MHIGAIRKLPEILVSTESDERMGQGQSEDDLELLGVIDSRIHTDPNAVTEYRKAKKKSWTLEDDDDDKEGATLM